MLKDAAGPSQKKFASTGMKTTCVLTVVELATGEQTVQLGHEINV